MNTQSPLPAASPDTRPVRPPSGIASAVRGAVLAASFSLSKLLEDATRYERDPTSEGELSYLCNIAENLLRARPGEYAEKCLRDFLSSLESALENEAEDRRWNGAERIEL